jgi:glycosyltransferase involved in cell wall biosynthesis
MKKLFIIANWMQGKALSGGDRIFIELSKRWSQKLDISIFLSKEGAHICRREDLSVANQNIWTSDIFSGHYLIDGIYRTITGIFKALRMQTNQGDIVLSSSDFLPDAIPAFILKLKNPQVKWIASFYLFAPKPWQKNSPYKGTKYLLGLVYWLSQLPAYYIIKKFSDIVFVTSQPDIKPFITKKRGIKKIIPVRGGVDVLAAKQYFEQGEFIPFENRNYDACFVGRFHYQKGVLELIRIWKVVCTKKPKCRLALIGIGPLEGEIQSLIKQMGLKPNITLLGFLNGTEKFNVFKQSKIVLHPATYDSGGMAPAEAMAWGLPGVSFDLESLKSYYPKGILKTECFNLDAFANNILHLLSDPNDHLALSQEALALIREQWNWDQQAHNILHQVTTILD